MGIFVYQRCYYKVHGTLFLQEARYVKVLSESETQSDYIGKYFQQQYSTKPLRLKYKLYYKCVIMIISQ